MAKSLLVDVIHVNSYVPPRLTDAEANAIQRTLHQTRFMSRLRRAVWSVFRQHPSLGKVRLTLTR